MVFKFAFKLKFENAPFPSITLCNINPYKASMIAKEGPTKAMVFFTLFYKLSHHFCSDFRNLLMVETFGF